jgi:hypothetical protein
MNNSFHPIISTARLALIIFTGALTNCQGGKAVHILSYEQGEALGKEYVRNYHPNQKQARWLGPPASLTRFRRANPANAPIITGVADIQEPNGQLRLLPGAIITIDKTPTFADEAANYVRVIGPGRHHMRVGGVGLLWSEVPSFHVERGDSIRITAHLLSEFRPTIN